MTVNLCRSSSADLDSGVAAGGFGIRTVAVGHIAVAPRRTDRELGPQVEGAISESDSIAGASSRVTDVCKIAAGGGYSPTWIPFCAR